MKTKYFEKMSDTMRLWTVPVIVGFSLILSGLGIVFILDMKALAMAMSGFMFLSGLLGVVYVCANKRQFSGWSFYLTLAILDFILGILLVATPEIKMTTISIMLSLWMVFQGLGKIIYSLDLQKIGIRNWDSDLVVGVLFIVYGAISIFMRSLSPAFVLLATALVLAFAGLFQISLALKRRLESGSTAGEISVEPVKLQVNVARNK